MISLVPLLLLAGYGYLVYRWASSTSAKATARRVRAYHSTKSADTKKERPNRTAAAQTAVAPY